jgi:hypothetical protein
MRAMASLVQDIWGTLPLVALWAEAVGTAAREGVE